MVANEARRTFWILEGTSFCAVFGPYRSNRTARSGPSRCTDSPTSATRRPFVVSSRERTLSASANLPYSFLFFFFFPIIVPYLLLNCRKKSSQLILLITQHKKNRKII